MILVRASVLITLDRTVACIGAGSTTNDCAHNGIAAVIAACKRTEAGTCNRPKTATGEGSIATRLFTSRI